MLNEIAFRSFTDTERSFTARQWMRKAAAQRKRGDARQQQSHAAIRARADEVVRGISGGDYILITYPQFLSVLLRRLRAHGFVVQRTGFMETKPFERFVASGKEAHCGGCLHNCYLSNPGYSVGRDKAARKGLHFTK